MEGILELHEGLNAVELHHAPCACAHLIVYKIYYTNNGRTESRSY
jgi:hypothetical protein